MPNNNQPQNLPEGWKRVRLGEVLKYEQPQKYLVKGENFDKKSGVPVLTAGKSFLLGFTDEKDGVYRNVPVIIFDDFTTDSKYISFPFKIKSSAIKILKTSTDEYNLFFLFNLLQKLKFQPSSEHKRYWISEFSKIEIPLPPLPEQRKIAEILETVDNAIEKTNRIIEKYKRIKQGLMQDLLTKGIDENSKIRNPKTHKFKNSPLGKIPEEWEVKQVYELINIISGGTPDTSNPKYWNGRIPWLSIEDFNTGKRWVFNSVKYITEEGLRHSSTNILKKGMLIISARGTVGILAQLGKDMAFNQSCYGLDSKNKNVLTNDFLYYSLSFYMKNFLNLAYGNVFDTITRNTFKDIKIPLPPLPEQKRIAQILSQIDHTIEKETAYKEKLQHIKKGLMEDLLTGKVRVKII